MTRHEIEYELQQMHQQSFAWALTCCSRNRSDAEDVLQMTYLKILDGSARFDDRSAFRTWVFGIIRNTATSKWRKLINRERLLQVFSFTQSETRVPGPEARIEFPARAKLLLRALNTLSPRQRELIQLVFYHDMTIEEAAETLSIGLGSARTHYTRGKRKLADILAEETP